MSMTRKHFNAIAADFAAAAAKIRTSSIDAYSTGYALGGLREVADNLCDTFGSVNPNFDRNRFLKACTLEY